MCGVPKILEAAVLHRLAPTLEDTVNTNQFVYARDRGAGLHLLQLNNFLNDEIARRRYVCIAAVDINGACDNLPYAGPVEALGRLKVDAFLVRFVARWFQCGRFFMKLRAPASTFPNKWRAISRGLP